MAGMIKQEDIEQVRQAADLYDVVSDSVSLKRSGSGEFMGLCPFHDEKTPSFAVRPALGMWHCFGCGLGGDVFAYVERHEGVGFADAVEILADKYGITLHYENQRGGQKRKSSSRTRLLQVNEEAQNFFTHNLLTKEALPARQLLGGRTFTQKDAQLFGCGYAPKGWDNLVSYLATKGFTHKEMVDAGVARPGKNGSVYDYFRGRLTWPIRDTAGRTLGFGARKLYDDDSIAAKYINTPDTQLYHKERVLYGLDLARKHIMHEHEIVVVEGYTDVMACHLAGIKTAVATCGTAFGEQHAKIARRLIGDTGLGSTDTSVKDSKDKQWRNPHIIFTFDGDAAGQKAARRAFRFNNEFLTQTFVAIIPGNLDPCDLRIHGEDVSINDLVQAGLAESGSTKSGSASNPRAGGLSQNDSPQPGSPQTRHIDGDLAVLYEIHHRAKPLYDYMIDFTLASFDTNQLPQKSQAVNELAALLAQIGAKSNLLGELYRKRVCSGLGISERQIAPLIRQSAREQHLRTFFGATPDEQHRHAQELLARMGLADRVHGVPGAPLEIVQQRYLDLLVMQDDYRRDYERLNLSWVQDPVYSSEQQLCAVVVQMPQALDPTQWARLTPESFSVPMFRALYTAVSVIGRLPRAGEQIASWMQELLSAGGPQIQPVITALAVTPLPIYSEDGELPASRRQDTGGDEQEVELRRRQESFAEPTADESSYAANCLAVLLDAGKRNSLAQLRAQFAAATDQQTKAAILQKIAQEQLEQKKLRQTLFDRSFGRSLDRSLGSPIDPSSDSSVNSSINTPMPSPASPSSEDFDEPEDPYGLEDGDEPDF